MKNEAQVCYVKEIRNYHYIFPTKICTLSKIVNFWSNL